MPELKTLKEKSVTSKEVAKLAGVSQSTVSRVFMAHTSATPATRKKVLAAAKELNYRPNAFARSLTTNESKLIGLVFPDTDYPLHMQTLQNLSKELQKHGYSTVLIPWEIKNNQEHSIPNIFQYRVDGVIAASTQASTALYDECQDINIPIIQFARMEEGTNHYCSAALSDNYTAGKEAAQLLIRGGGRHLSYITGDIPSFTDNERRMGFIDEVRLLTGTEPRIITASYQYEPACKIIKKTLKHPSDSEAFFCATDVIAIALMDTARYEYGMNIPHDIQIVGYDDIPQASWLSYQITTFRQDFPRLAQESIRLLLNCIHMQSTQATKLLIPSRLIIRNTTRNETESAGAL